VTLFELLTQQQPFVATEALGYIHCHMAKPPPNPCDVIIGREGRDVELPPQGLCDVISKLLAKTAEERYDSADGLLMDLRFLQSRVALAQAGSKAAVSELGRFNAGRMDRASRFTPSHKLYGRADEVGLLLDSFARVEQNGAVEAVMVRGYSGIGKSAIVNEVHKAISRHKTVTDGGHRHRRRGYFITWKFDQLCKSTASVVMAFGDLIEQLLSEGQEVVDAWAERIREAVGANGQLLVELLPELQVLIGPQAAVAELALGEAQNRFNRTFQQFVRVFCGGAACDKRKGEASSKLNIGPLVMFVDDLQWADVASLKLLELIASDSEQSHFMLIGAYRDNEIDAMHPLNATLRELANNQVPLIDIEVKPLGREYVVALVEDTLRCGRERASGMASLLEEKTSGNPFFINQLLRFFYTDGLIHFTFGDVSPVPNDDEDDEDSAESVGRNGTGGQWDWDLDELRRVAVTENVVELMVKQIQRLSVEAQQILQLAAAIGDRFSLDTLGVVAETSPEQAEQVLLEPLHAGLILQLTSRYSVFTPAQDDSPLNSLRDTDASAQRAYKFLHDRVQQAAYSLIPHDRRSAMHLHIGRRLLTHTGGDEAKIDEDLFAIVNQINIGIDLIMEGKNEGQAGDEDKDKDDEEAQSQAEEIRCKEAEAGMSERERVARLNFAAGKKARASMAYHAAVKYLDLAIRLLGAHDVEGAEDDSHGRGLADACWQGDRRGLTMEVFLEATVAQFLSTDFDKAEQLCTTMLRHAATRVEKVAVYEIQMQFHIQQQQMRQALDIGLAALEMLGVELVASRPTLQLSDEEYCSGLAEMKDEAMLAAMRILMNLCAPTYVLEVHCSLSPPSLGDVLTNRGWARMAAGAESPGGVHDGGAGD
jgi:predicted ATPase